MRQQYNNNKKKRTIIIKQRKIDYIKGTQRYKVVSSFWCLICRIHAVAAVTYWSLSSVTVIIISLINASFVDAVLPHKWITTAISKTSIFLRPFISLFHFHFYYYFGLSFVKHTTLFTGILSFRYVFFSVLIILI